MFAFFLFPLCFSHIFKAFSFSILSNIFSLLFSSNLSCINRAFILSLLCSLLSNSPNSLSYFPTLLFSLSLSFSLYSFLPFFKTRRSSLLLEIPEIGSRTFFDTSASLPLLKSSIFSI